jgi:hypothetical protein
LGCIEEDCSALILLAKALQRAASSGRTSAGDHGTNVVRRRQRCNDVKGAGGDVCHERWSELRKFGTIVELECLRDPHGDPQIVDFTYTSSDV